MCFCQGDAVKKEDVSPSTFGSQIYGTTKIVPHLAHPTAHLRTGSFFNPRCRALGIDAVLVPWDVTPESLPAAWVGLRNTQNVPGVVVTLPHKQAVAALCELRTGAAAKLNVANVARRLPDGRFEADMLDGAAFVAGLKAEGHALAGKRALLLGAGGAATAIALALAEADIASLAIANRSTDKAAALADRITSLCPDKRIYAGEANARGYDLVVNATSLGMHEGDPLPVAPESIAPGCLVAEIVMQPDVTALLRVAQARGAVTHRGVHMILAQIDALIVALFGPGALNSSDNRI